MDTNQNQDSQPTPKQQVAERVRQATNVLVTVRSNPSVDELAATIGLTLMLNKLGKHATAVFSGTIPSTIEFLKPEETLEKNTDSLRDFIVSLDKNKADKLRYKVEENVVRIFITPYRTSISQDDLEFTQGDFNVDVVLALGVTAKEELDQAITAHGRILHDAAVISVTAGQRESELGIINWQDAAASSLSEMLVSISEALQGGIIDAQMATAFLTGIVAETERFSNTKTTPKVMTMAAQLMAAGANQQLIANELQKLQDLPADQPASVPHEAEVPAAVVSDDGSLTIEHHDAPPPESPQKTEQAPASEPVQHTESPPILPDPTHIVSPSSQEQSSSFLPETTGIEPNESFEPLLASDPHHDEQDKAPEDIFANLDAPAEQPATDPQIHIDEHGNLIQQERPIAPHHKVIQPLDSPQAQLPENDLTKISSLLQEQMPPATPGVVTPEQVAMPPLDLPAVPPVSTLQGTPQVTETVHPSQPEPDTTLLDIEKAVNSPHIGNESAAPRGADVSDARNAVMDAIKQIGYDPNRPEPRVDINAQPLGMPQQIVSPSQSTLNDQAGPPPPVPPPMMPPTFS